MISLRSRIISLYSFNFGWINSTLLLDFLTSLLSLPGGLEGGATGWKLPGGLPASISTFQNQDF